MGLLSRLFGGGAPAADWMEVLPGARVRDPWGRDSVVRSAAVYDLEVEGGEPGDAQSLALVWTERGGDVDLWLVQRDVYGEPGPATVEVVGAVEPDAEGSGAVRDLPAGAGFVTARHPRHGPLEGDRQAATLRRADGPYAGDCPADGTASLLFRSGSKDVRRFLLVLADRHGTPRVVGWVRTP